MENVDKVREYCNANNIEVFITEDPLDYLTEQIVEVLMEENDNEAKKLFKEVEKKDDTIYGRVHDRMFDYIDNMIDTNFDTIRDFFKSEVEEERKYL